MNDLTPEQQATVETAWRDGEFRRLASDVARVAEDYRGGHGTTGPSVEAAIRATRDDLDLEKIEYAVEQGTMPPDLAVSYRRVLEADEAEVTSPAVTSHADGIVVGVFDSWYGGPCPSEAYGEPASSDGDQGDGDQGDDDQGDPAEVVTVAEDRPEALPGNGRRRPQGERAQPGKASDD